MAIHNRYTKEEIDYLKQNYATASWNEILSHVHRDKGSIVSKASKLGLKRTNASFSAFNEDEDKLIMETYQNSEYGQLDFNLQQLVDDYLPHRTIGSIKNRAVRIGAQIRKSWTQEEDEFLISHYYDLTVNELTEKFENHNRESVYNRICKLGLKGASKFAFTEEEIEFIRENYQKLSDDQIGEIIGRSGNSVKTFRSKHQWHKPKPDGVIYYLNSFIDRNNTQWKRESARNCNYKCMITGDRFDNIHHLYARNLIINDMKALHADIPTNKNINELDEEMRNNILRWFQDEQAKHPLGICLRNDIHKEFHERYGFGYNTPDQFYEFVKDIAPDRLDDIMNL